MEKYNTTIKNILEKNREKIEKEKREKNTLYHIKPFEKYTSYTITSKGIEKLKQVQFPKEYEYLKNKKYYGKNEQEQGKTIIEILNSIA